MRAMLVIPAEVGIDQGTQFVTTQRHGAASKHLLLEGPEEPFEHRGGREAVDRAVAVQDAPALAPGPIPIAVELRAEVGDDVLV